MNARVRIALVGCGLIGREHLRAWEAVARVAGTRIEVAAVCDSDKVQAEKAAAEVRRWQTASVTVYTSYEDLLEDKIDGLDVCLPTHLHERVACAALSAGMHVMVEKPLAMTIMAAQKMRDTALRANRILSLAEDHRRTATIRTVRWLVHDVGLIGEPQLLQAQRTRYEAKPARTGWRGQRGLGGGGWAIDNGAHLLDSLCYVLGPLKSVTAVAKRLRDLPIVRDDGVTGVDEREDFLTALLSFEGGTTGIFSCTSSLPYADEFSFALRGTRGAIVDDGGQLFHAPLPEARVRSNDGRSATLREYQDEFLSALPSVERERLFPFGLTHSFAIECAEFLLAISEGKEVEIDADVALTTLASSLAFYESALAGRTVSVAEVLDGTTSAYQSTIKSGPLESDFCV